MADARLPPSGPPPRDPTGPARLLDAAAEVGLRVERAQRHLDGLSQAVEKLAGSTGHTPAAGPPSAPGDAPFAAPGVALRDAALLAGARAFAIDLAVGGVTRDSIREQLRVRFGLEDPDALLAEIMAPGPGPPPDADPPDDIDPSDDPPGGNLPDDVDRSDPPRGAGPPASTPPAAQGVDVSDAQAPPADRPRGMLGPAIQSYGAQIGVAALSLVNVIVMARALGATGRGEVAFLTAIAFLGSNVWTMGVQEANVNLAGSEPATRRSLATNSLILSALLGATGALLIAGFIFVVPAAGAGLSWALLWLIFASLPMLVLNTYLRFLIQGDYGFGVTNLAWFLPAVINVTVNGAFAVVGALSVWVAVSTWVGGQTLATGLLIWHVQRRSAGFGRPDAGLARRTLRFGVKSHVGRIMLLANYRLDQWILGAVAGTKQLGQYSVAVAWAEALFLLPTALSAVQRPAIVRASPRDAVLLTARVFRISLLITGALGVGLVIFAPVLCVTIFGEEFRDSVADLRVLAGGAFGVVALKQLGNALTGRDRPLAASLSIGSAFVFTVALDIALIPAYGDLGAAIASSVAYTLGGIVIIVVFARSLGGRTADLVPRPRDIADLWGIARGVLRRGRNVGGAVEQTG